VKRIQCSPTSGAPLPFNFGTLAPGESRSIDLVGYVPADVTSIRRWVDTGTATVGATTVTF
ncbi:MAG TPA: hypothetical protein VFU47_12740, partial [Armatimonadota bacterium]|nr:hypothetical protein [Armatimonadota bacterium]